MDYHVVSQGKTSIPGVDDAEELGLTDVRKYVVSPTFYKAYVNSFKNGSNRQTINLSFETLNWSKVCLQPLFFSFIEYQMMVKKLWDVHHKLS
jgi:hypothetical protein